jgi:hypothetical protein
LLPPPLLLLLLLQDVLWWVLYKAEAVLLGSRLRKWSLDEVGAHAHAKGYATSLMARVYGVISAQCTPTHTSTLFQPSKHVSMLIFMICHMQIWPST